MIAAALMWSIAGVVTRHLEAARAFEITFWRSAFNAFALVILLSWLRGPAVVWRTVLGGGRALWLSAACWCVMFTAFMLALTLTTVANVLVTMALAPLFTALGARVLLKHRLAARTWLAIVVAGAGIGWMYGSQVSGGDARQWLGTLVALAVPVAAATNWTLLQRLARRPAAAAPRAADSVASDTTNSATNSATNNAANGATTHRPASAAAPADMLVAVLLGALLSALLTLPLALPFEASAHDLRLLGLLGVVQLAIPCLMSVVAARTLSAPEASLFALLEVVFGVVWAWLGAGETPTFAVLGGGALVLSALIANEAMALRSRSR